MKKSFLFVLIFGFAVTALVQSYAIAAPAAQPAEVKKAEVKKEPAEKKPVEKKVEKKAEKKAEKVVTIKGNVISVDAAANTVVVGFEKGKKEVQETIAIDAKTKIKKGKEEVAISELQVGEKVTAKCTVVDGKKVAKSITIAVKKAAAEKKPVEKKEVKTEKKAEPAAK